MLTEDMKMFISDHCKMVKREIAREAIMHCDEWFVTNGNFPKVFADPMEPIINGWQ